MFEIFNWLLEHPCVKLQFYGEPVTEALKIRITRGRYNAEHSCDVTNLFYMRDPKQYLTSVLDELYEMLKREEQKYE